MTAKINGRTPEEIKKGLEYCTDICDEGCDVCVYDSRYNRRDKLCLVQLKLDALAYIQQLESAQPKWISVEENPPKTGETVQLLWKRASGKCRSVCGYMSPLSDIAKTFRFYIFDYNVYAWEDVTHWAPLLEAPKEEK